jgi:DNA-binding NarL/FixJ family response regulator
VSDKRANLSRREREVLTLVASGRTAHDVARSLGLAKRTVDEHLACAVRRLDAASQADAVAIAIRRGLVGQRPPVSVRGRTRGSSPRHG